MSVINRYRKDDWQERAIPTPAIKFQGHAFRQCMGYSEWVRWGPYCIDRRPVLEYFGIEPLGWDATFKDKIAQITNAVGDKNFLLLLSAIKDKEEAKLALFKAEQRLQGINDDLPF